MTLVEVGTYLTATEATLVKARLLTHGVEAVVEGDVASGSIPTIEAITGVKVLVREHDLPAAMEALQRMLPPEAEV